ncbi:MAG: recombinase RecA [Clostridiaceae bacterium]|nr:recombinase RecA [Clostridiaceae bacterium]
MSRVKKRDILEPLPAEERAAALETTMKAIAKDFGPGAIMKMGEHSKIKVQAMSTGIMPLDLALGIGGLPKGRIIEVYGPESSGKTTVALHMIAACQKQGGNAAFIDAEHALDPEYAAKLGVDIDNLLISQPDYGEQGLSIAEALVKSGAIDMVVIDSVAALTPRAEIDGGFAEQIVGSHARMMSMALRRLASTISRTDCIVIFINQLREKIPTGWSRGPTETTTGGRALRFYASVRLEVRRGERLTEKQVPIGVMTIMRVTKNKVAPPFKTVSIELLFGQGLNLLDGLVEAGVTTGVITKAGSWFSYGDLRLGQGKSNSAEFIDANPELRQEIEAKILEHLDDMRNASYYDEDGESDEDDVDDESDDDERADKLDELLGLD